MKVKIWVPLATAHQAFQAGEVVDLPDELAGSWCASGVAVPVLEDHPGRQDAHPIEDKTLHRLPCPRCGRTFLSHRALQVHLSRSHRGGIADA